MLNGVHPSELPSRALLHQCHLALFLSSSPKADGHKVTAKLEKGLAERS